MKIGSPINLPWGHARFHQKFGPDRFSFFEVYWIQTNKQTPRQAKFIYRYKVSIHIYKDAWHDRRNKCLISGNKISWIPLTDQLTKNVWNVHCSGLNHIIQFTPNTGYKVCIMGGDKERRFRCVSNLFNLKSFVQRNNPHEVLFYCGRYKFLKTYFSRNYI